MNCSEFQHRFERLLDAQELTAAASTSFLDHIQRCGNHTCAEMWADQQVLASAVKQWQQSLPEVDLAERVVSELNGIAIPAAGNRQLPARLEPKYRLVQLPADSAWPATKSIPKSLRSWGSVATVAAALMLVSLLMLTPRGSSPVATEREEVPLVVAANGEKSALAGRHWTPSSPDLFDSYAAIPLSATEFVTDALVLVVPADLAEPDAPPSRAALWADHLEKHWEPIGKELSSAFDVLLKTAPPAADSAT